MNFFLHCHPKIILSCCAWSWSPGVELVRLEFFHEDSQVGESFSKNFIDAELLPLQSCKFHLKFCSWYTHHCKNTGKSSIFIVFPNQWRLLHGLNLPLMINYKTGFVYFLFSFFTSKTDENYFSSSVFFMPWRQ